MRPHPLFLWQNEQDQRHQRVSWCSHHQYGSIATDSCFNPECLSFETHTKLRDQKNSLSLNDLLGEVIFANFSVWLHFLADDEYLQLHLIKTLPESWQQLPLEWCYCDGEPLYKKIQVIRHAALPQTMLPVYRQQQALIINLWPQATNHQQFFEDIIYDPDFQVVQGRFKATLHVQNQDISQLTLLCIIAHGNEHNYEDPFLCERAQAWSLPEKQLPPLVLLIACGGEQGNLLSYGKMLLQQGAKTVIAAKGKLDASQITPFLACFFQQWKTGQNAEHILFTLQVEDTAEHAARRLHVIGQSGLSQPCATKNDLSSWERLSQSALYDDHALLLLLEKITLHNLVTHSSVAASVNDLYTTLGFNYNDPHEKRSLLYDRLVHCYPQCCAITQKWLSCFLMYLSSLHQHAVIDQYQKEIARLATIKISGLDSFFFYMASGKYRSRQHEQASKIIVDGIQQVSIKQNKRSTRQDDVSSYWFKRFVNSTEHHHLKNKYLSQQTQSSQHETKYKLYELALNICIVMGLTELGDFYLERADEDLLSADITEEQRALEAFTQLDRTARLYIRQGDPDNDLHGDAGLIYGLHALDEKRQIAIEVRAENGERELCLLLYFSAWLQHETPNSDYITTALAYLAPVEQICAELCSKTGNLTKLYLLRALAAWAYLQQDLQATALLEQYLPTIITLCQRVTRYNAAPLGFIIAYLSLIGNPHAKQQWFYIANKMLRDKCYFELAMFHKLMQQPQKSLAAYKKHKQQQQRVFNTLKTLQCETEHQQEYQQLIKSTQQRLANENINDVITLQENAIQQLGFVPC